MSTTFATKIHYYCLPGKEAKTVHIIVERDTLLMADCRFRSIRDILAAEKGNTQVVHIREGVMNTIR